MKSNQQRKSLRNQCCLHIIAFAKSRIQHLYNSFLISISSHAAINKKLIEEKEIAYSLIESCKKDLAASCQYIENRVEKKVVKLWDQFEPLEEDHSTINRLQFILLLRKLCDLLGCTNTQDVAIIQLALGISQSNPSQNPHSIKLKKEKLLDKSSLQNIKDLIRINIIKGNNKEDPFYKDNDQVKVGTVIEYLNKNFTSYDFTNENLLLLDCMLLLFTRICLNNKLKDLNSAYKEFQRHLSLSTHKSRYNKEEVTSFIINYINSGKAACHKDLPMYRSISAFKLSREEEQKSANSQKAEPLTEINTISKRLASVESTMNNLVKSTDNSDFEGALNKALKGTLKDIISSTRRERDLATMPRRIESKFMINNLGHRCISQYCLLCRKQAYVNK